MVYFWRGLAVFAVLNLINIIAVDGGVGMEIVWLGIIGISLVLSFKKPVRWLFSKKYIKPVFWLAITIFLVTQSVIIFHGLGLNVPENTDYLIVLGARIRGETPSLALQYRLDVAYDYLEQNPSTKAILTGGQGAGESITEAEAMKRYLVGKGISVERLVLESQATNTIQNLSYSFELIDASIEDLQVIVVTSRFHILRSKIIAKELGWKVDGIGAKTLPFLIPSYYLREFFAVLAQVIF